MLQTKKPTYTCTRIYMYMLLKCLHKNMIQWTAWSLPCNCLNFGKNCCDIIIQSQQHWVWFFLLSKPALVLWDHRKQALSLKEIWPLLSSASKSCDLRRGTELTVAQQFSTGYFWMVKWHSVLIAPGLILYLSGGKDKLPLYGENKIKRVQVPWLGELCIEPVFFWHSLVGSSTSIQVLPFACFAAIPCISQSGLLQLLGYMCKSMDTENSYTYMVHSHTRLRNNAVELAANSNWMKMVCTMIKFLLLTVKTEVPVLQETSVALLMVKVTKNNSRVLQKQLWPFKSMAILGKTSQNLE